MIGSDFGNKAAIIISNRCSDNAYRLSPFYIFCLSMKSSFLATSCNRKFNLTVNLHVLSNFFSTITIDESAFYDNLYTTINCCIVNQPRFFSL
jgi:hypothetical protein